MKCIIFDVFGTLFHYDRNIFNQEFVKTYQVLKDYQFNISYADFKVKWKETFLTNMKIAKGSLDEFSLYANSIDFLRKIDLKSKTKYLLAQKLTDTFTYEWLSEIEINPHVSSLLSELYANHLLIAVSNINDSRVLSELFVKYKINNLFSLTLTSIGFSKRKPAEEIALYIKRFINNIDVDYIFIGDSLEEDKLFAEKFNARFIHIELPSKLIDPMNNPYTKILNVIN